MYYLLYGFLYLFSLLPFPVLYFMGDGLSFFLRHVIHYRKEIIYSNLENAFPEKNKMEIDSIVADFYRNLTNSMMETIKLLSLSKKQIFKRANLNATDINRISATGQNIQFNAAHLFGWEYLSLVMAGSITIPFVGIYMKITSNAVNRLYLKFRSRTGAFLITAADMPKQFPQMKLEQYALGFIADQNPPNEKSAYWLNYFHRPTPFLTGPEKFAERNKTAVFFISVNKIKRGYYEYLPVLVTQDATKMTTGELTRKYRDFMEGEIRKDPANYLWSHRRWKTPWNIAYKRKWVDENEMPK